MLHACKEATSALVECLRTTAEKEGMFYRLNLPTAKMTQLPVPRDIFPVTALFAPHSLHRKWVLTDQEARQGPSMSTVDHQLQIMAKSNCYSSGRLILQQLFPAWLTSALKSKTRLQSGL